MAKGPISDKQAQILEYIKDQIMEKGYPPAVREICRKFDTPKSPRALRALFF